ncbi:M1 family metallopeptidase [Ichthyobacterium seriolicida]|uniref:Zn-dependent aminopeptidase n=1 Tax=Ichthyobacterium seriolicida TaxID=242600 RepID=A0A1J1DYM6_9FLAO|nr:M1 family metallopeptidase [Ichthyobacterium seriolicida]BAV94993.1 Zn-dependent aminopeptidase [Ichthyobacterium seriolicida]
MKLSLFNGILLFMALSFSWFRSSSQTCYWQQKVSYVMEIDINTDDNTFLGKQQLTYYNNSPDTLRKVFYHLYYNAFKPESMMDVRSRLLEDPDERISNKILGLKEDEIGYQMINSLKQDGVNLDYKVEGTILEVVLNKPISPNSSSIFEMEFKAQIPIQLRRTGRNSAEGVKLSMTQWYPKMAEYDKNRWNTDSYVGREFHGVWGDFDVKITIDKEYLIGSTGILLNPEKIGHGYEKKGTKVTRDKRNTWHFRATDVHDFAWAADTDYLHDKVQVPEGPLVHFIYKNNPKFLDNWKKVQPLTVKFFQEMKKEFGAYPYSKYTIIQGGDGGMEYPMCTLITGNRKFKSLARVIMHEAAHSWFHGVLATDEGKYAWMDEGFTSYATTVMLNRIIENKTSDSIFEKTFQSYFDIVKSGKEEPLSIHADHFSTNYAYGIGSYIKGQIFLVQLKYIIGKQNFDNTMKEYFSKWKFKHPDYNDLKRIAEKISDIHLGWYLNYWINTTHTIDYSVKTVLPTKENTTEITLEKIGKMPMPIDLVVTYNDGQKELFYIPISMMRGEKPNETNMKRTLLKDWPWTHPLYTFTVNTPFKNIKSVVIDSENIMADINRKDNIFPIKDEKITIKGN